MIDATVDGGAEGMYHSTPGGGKVGLRAVPGGSPGHNSLDVISGLSLLLAYWECDI